MQGRVIKSTGSWYNVVDKNDKQYSCRLRGKFKISGIKVTNPIAVGDYVEFELEKEDVGLIINILPRENYVIRKSIKSAKEGHILAANIDQAVLIVTLTKPRTSLGFIDRFLVTAEAFRIPAILIFNKSDLYDDELLESQKELSKIYEALGYQTLLVSAFNEQDQQIFYDLLKNKTSLISGHSGVGKSTLINKIAPEINQKTQEVSSFANKGVHTTTFAEMFKIDRNSYVIDSPGIKELGILDIEKEELSHFFPEMRALLGKCKFHNCMHLQEPKCAVIQAIEQGNIALSRYESYMSILENEDNRR
ncbi:ribosome small subunit-dependent GTPase A [Fulvivirgaceae bacterium BMA10]|uniref:Small ribosomal subunit biogenesis GTPase RsgA n=1 Tax=Splendidivirga corallicola TaxID=3051826 RepID=A0ABT8KUS0_9BACT|nr:ribosome small subunit-dependent GTPase A [Fulvivirgaceae bacterium BMA10]